MHAFKQLSRHIVHTKKFILNTGNKHYNWISARTHTRARKRKRAHAHTQDTRTVTNLFVVDEPHQAGRQD